MVTIEDIQKTYSQVLGAVLVVIGLLGLFPPTTKELLSWFGVNLLQTLVHLGGGALLYWTAGKTATQWLGWIALVIAGLGFFAADLSHTLLNTNDAITYLHIAIALVSLGVGYGISE